MVPDADVSLSLKRHLATNRLTKRHTRIDHAAQVSGSSRQHLVHAAMRPKNLSFSAENINLQLQ